ncbi:hypothetical protein LguiA_029642 [Lonicera macranthoides]
MGPITRARARKFKEDRKFNDVSHDTSLIGQTLDISHGTSCVVRVFYPATIQRKHAVAVGDALIMSLSLTKTGKVIFGYVGGAHPVGSLGSPQNPLPPNNYGSLYKEFIALSECSQEVFKSINLISGLQWSPKIIRE